MEEKNIPMLTLLLLTIKQMKSELSQEELKCKTYLEENVLDFGDIKEQCLKFLKSKYYISTIDYIEESGKKIILPLSHPQMFSLITLTQTGETILQEKYLSATQLWIIAQKEKVLHRDLERTVLLKLSDVLSDAKKSAEETRKTAKYSMVAAFISAFAALLSIAITILLKLCI